MPILLLATRNEHKTQEIRALLTGQCECRSLRELPGAPEVIEDADTFAGNAAKKASALARWWAEHRRTLEPIAAGPGMEERECFVLADDSGLEVDVLRGAPGVHSARFAALDTGQGAPTDRGNSSDTDNNAKLIRLLRHVPWEERTARFRCVLALAPVALATAPPPLQLFEGVCEGRIGFQPSGGGGFGYDPLFIPAGFGQSFAELGTGLKNKISHRARALEKLKQRLRAVKRDP